MWSSPVSPKLVRSPVSTMAATSKRSARLRASSTPSGFRWMSLTWRMRVSPSAAGPRGSAAVLTQLVELTGEVGQPIAHTAERTDLPLDRFERGGSAFEGALEARRLEGRRPELLPGPALQEADRHHATDGTEHDVAPATARQQRPDHAPGQRGDEQGLDDQLDDERRDVDAGVVLEAPHRIGQPGDGAGPIEVDLR